MAIWKEDEECMSTVLVNALDEWEIMSMPRRGVLWCGGGVEDEVEAE
jgi:hypothetical protein